MNALFLSPEEVAELTGIKRGYSGKSRGQLQCEHLRKLGIPFFPNAAGEPKIARSYIENRVQPTDKPKKGWEPAVLQKVA